MMAERGKKTKPKGDPRLAALLAADTQGQIKGNRNNARHTRFGGVYVRSNKVPLRCALYLRDITLICNLGGPE